MEQITDIKAQDDRRVILRDRRLVYENDWEEILDDELKAQFTKETVANIKLMQDDSNNIFRRIVREICTVYKKGVKREILEGGEELESDIWDEMMDESKLDWILGEAHRLSKAQTISFLRVYYVEKRQKIAVEIIPADFVQVDLDPDDPFEIKGFGYRVKRKTPSGGDVEAWIYMTEEKIYYLDSSGSPIKNPYVEEPEVTEEDNIYGMIPVVPFHAVAPVRSFWRLNWNKDAYNGSIMVGVLSTYLNYLVKTQSFKQVYFSGGKASTDMIRGIFDPLFPISLPDGASAGVLDLQARVDAISDVIQRKSMNIANNYGISPQNFTMSGDVQSGFAIKVSNRSLEEIREADKLLAFEVEKKLFNVIRTVGNYWGRGIGELWELKWNPGEISYPMTWEETEKKWLFEFKAGATNVIDYIMSTDPELSREEAMERVLEIQDENEELSPSLREQMFAREAEEEGLEEEEDVQ